MRTESAIMLQFSGRLPGGSPGRSPARWRRRPRTLLVATALTTLAAGAIGCGSASSGAPSAETTSPRNDASTMGDDDAAAMSSTDAAGADATASGSPPADGGAAPGDGGAVDGGAVDASLPGYTLTWADEFNGPDGSAVDSTKWKYDTGAGGWGNSELEDYTSGTSNAVVEDGHLVITARRSCPDGGGACTYTSARLLTEGKFSQQYGRFEARIQIPAGQGLWPAFWMLGDNIDQVSWPACGEIDVMENIGKEPTMVHGSLHAPGLNLTGTYTLPGGGKFAGGYHTFAVDWDASGLRFYVDDTLYETQTPGDAPGGSTWAFDHPFFVLLNVAVGGTWPGNPDGTTTFPQTMNVDWVRVYQKNP